MAHGLLKVVNQLTIIEFLVFSGIPSLIMGTIFCGSVSALVFITFIKYERIDVF